MDSLAFPLIEYLPERTIVNKLDLKWLPHWNRLNTTFRHRITYHNAQVAMVSWEESVVICSQRQPLIDTSPLVQSTFMSKATMRPCQSSGSFFDNLPPFQRLVTFCSILLLSTCHPTSTSPPVNVAIARHLRTYAKSCHALHLKNARPTYHGADKHRSPTNIQACY